MTLRPASLVVCPRMHVHDCPSLPITMSTWVRCSRKRRKDGFWRVLPLEEGLEGGRELGDVTPGLEG